MTDTTLSARPSGRKPLLPEALREVYDLTRAEAEVLTWLVDGLSVKEIARVRHVSVNTARAQLKSVMSKTGVHRQMDLIRLVYAGPADAPGDGRGRRAAVGHCRCFRRRPAACFTCVVRALCPNAPSKSRCWKPPKTTAKSLACDGGRG